MAEKTKAPAVRSIKPGAETLTYFLRENSKLFNLSEWERLCELPSGTLRHAAAGSRGLDRWQYEKVRDIVLPKLCEISFILQNYLGY